MKKKLNLLEQTLARLNHGPNFNKNKTSQRRNRKGKGGNLQNPPNRKTSQPKRARKSRANRGTGSIPPFPSGLGRGGFGKQKMIVTQDENLGTISSVGNNLGYSVLSQFPINPGQASTFPWLSSIAKNFEKYKFLKLEFYTIPQVSAFATSGQTGEVILSCDYDASDAAPGTYQQQTDQWPHCSKPPPLRLNLPLDAKQLHKESDAKFVRPGGVLGGTDIKTYDAGNVFVGAVNIGGTPSVVLCSLHVRYSCELTIPILENFAAAPQNNSVTFLADYNAALTTATPYQPLLASAATTSLQVTNGLAVVNTAGSIVPAPGNYILNIATTFANTSSVMSLCYLKVFKNGNLQNPQSGVTAAFENTAATDEYVTLNASQFISCNGTDAITLSIESVFAAGTTTATTTFLLTAV